jgi:hypothetical protein
MRRYLLVSLVALAPLLLLGPGGCKTPPARPYREPPPPDLKATAIDYTDSDAFDALFEAALTNQDPVVVIRTAREKPDWEPRLNAWIAAWNLGGKVGPPKATVRMAAPLLPSVTVDADSIREFRLLIESLMDRVEDIARRQSAWWAEERTRARRVALLRPYNLRFHLDEEKTIQLIFFNGSYAQYYPQFMQSIAQAEADEPAEWSRTFRCSRCKGYRDGSDQPEGAGRLTGRTSTE